VTIDSVTAANVVLSSYEMSAYDVVWISISNSVDPMSELVGVLDSPCHKAVDGVNATVRSLDGGYTRD
jgi:hypothetical protein